MKPSVLFWHTVALLIPLTPLISIQLRLTCKKIDNYGRSGHRYSAQRACVGPESASRRVDGGPLVPFWNQIGYAVEGSSPSRYGLKWSDKLLTQISGPHSQHMFGDVKIVVMGGSHLRMRAMAESALEALKIELPSGSGLVDLSTTDRYVPCYGLL